MSGERVMVLTGPLKGEEFEIDETLTIGRSPSNHLFLDVPQVSRKHALIEQTPSGTVIRDLGSGNGVFVGGRQVLEYSLSDGERIRIGPIELRYVDGTSNVADAMTDFHAIDTEDLDSTVNAAPTGSVYESFFGDSSPAADTPEFREIQKRLKAIYEANQQISAEQDLSRVFEQVLDQLFALVPAHSGAILLKVKGQEGLTEGYSKSVSGSAGAKVSLKIAERAFENAEAILTHDAAEDDRFDASGSIIGEHISSAMCVPLTHQDERLGVVYVDNRSETNAFGSSDLELMVALAGPAAIAIRNAQYLSEVQRAYDDTLRVIANTIEARDHYTVGHTWRVTNFCVEIGRELGWPEERLRDAETGGILHDLGKIAVPDAILNKPGKLTAEEDAKMRVHPEKGARMMQDIRFLTPIIPYALYHHEQFDGSGYPFKLAGEEIPLEGRVIAVADAFDAMTSTRPYHKGIGLAEALEELERGRGRHFDPACLDAFLRAYDDGRIERVMQDFFKESGSSVLCPFCSTHIRIAEDASGGDEFQCNVCHHRIRVQKLDGMRFAELIIEPV